MPSRNITFYHIDTIIIFRTIAYYLLQIWVFGEFGKTIFCQVKQVPFKYLGAPIYKGRCRNQLFEEIIEKFSSKIEGWYARFLLSRQSDAVEISSAESSNSHFDTQAGSKTS